MPQEQTQKHMGPVPPDPAKTEHIEIGPLTMGIEYRVLYPRDYDFHPQRPLTVPAPVVPRVLGGAGREGESPDEDEAARAPSPTVRDWMTWASDAAVGGELFWSDHRRRVAACLDGVRGGHTEG